MLVCIPAAVFDLIGNPSSDPSDSQPYSVFNELAEEGLVPRSPVEVEFTTEEVAD